MSSSRTATPRSTMPRGAEIRLVAARELRAQLLKKSSLAATIVLLVITVGGILAYSYVTGDDDEPYRLGVLMAGAADAADPADATDSIEPAEAGAHASTSVLEQIKGIKDSKERPIEVVDLSGARPEAALGIDDGAPESPGGATGTAGAVGTVDMVLDLTGETPGLLVSRNENSDSAVVAAVTNILQQAALSDQVTALGGDPATTAGALAEAAPRVEALDPPRYDSEDFGARYATLGLIDILMIIVIMGGGQTIAMGVVEEKSSRIVEILLACVRPGSLLAGKILGTGVAVILSYGLIGLAAGAAAELTGVLPEALFSIDAVVVAMIVWMIVGYAIAAAAYGAAGALVSRQEDAASVTMPLTMLFMIPYMLSFVMAMDPSKTVFRVLAYLPPLSPFLMPARLVLGVSNWAEQLVALAVALAFIPLLVRLAATVYTRAVTRTGSRVRLKEVLSRETA